MNTLGRLEWLWQGQRATIVKGSSGYSVTFSYFHPLEEQSLGCLYTMSLACLALTTRGDDELDPAAADVAALRLAFSDCSLLALVELDSSVEQTAFPRSSG